MIMEKVVNYNFYKIIIQNFTFGNIHADGLEGFLGKSLPEILGMPNNCQDEDFCLEWGSAAKFTVAKTGDFCYDLRWSTNILQKFQDCFSLGSSTGNNVYWFGGPEEYYQRFPMNPEATRESVPYLPGGKITFYISNILFDF